MSEVSTKYLSQITLLDGTVVYIKDTVAREAVAGGTHFRGVTTTALTDGASTNPITISGQSYTAVNGDIVVYGNKEFIFAEFDSKWHELGDTTNLGALALKDSASGSYTPAGEVTFSGALMSSTGAYTPAGEVSKPDVDVTETSISIKEFDQAGSVTAGTAAQCTLPTFSATYDESNENLTIGWTAGSFTANQPTAVTLPTSKQTNVLSGVSAELHEAPTFSGSAATITVEGTPGGTATFSGTAATITVS